MEQSQVKPSHCCIQTPWLAHESSWQVVLGPSSSEEQKRRKKERELFKLMKVKAITRIYSNPKTFKDTTAKNISSISCKKKVTVYLQKRTETYT